MVQYGIRLNHEEDKALYTVNWSPFIVLDKWRIRSLIPAEAGIFQLYIKKGANLELMSTHSAYYGGLRSTFMEILDEDCQISFPDKELYRTSETYLRYTLSSSREDLNDILHHFTGSDSSGRFSMILVDEKECMKIQR